MRGFPFFITFLLAFNFSYGQCGSSFIVLSSQEDVNSFSVNYPDCTNPHYLYISGSDIVDLNPLSQLEQIKIDLRIESNPLLESLTGLENISLGNNNTRGILYIRNNPSLISLDGLLGISCISNVGMDDIKIENNASLISISALSSINVIVYFVEINNNQILTSINAIQDFSEIKSLIVKNNSQLETLPNIPFDEYMYNVEIIGNPQLQSLIGLEAITKITQRIYINNNDLLANIDPLSGVLDGNTVVEGSSLLIEINDNELLTDISGIANINPLEIESLSIIDNPNLSTCNVISVCNHIQNNGTAQISNNTVGCNSVEEVFVKCSTTFNAVVGNVQFDNNQDGCDETDFKAPNRLIDVSNSTETRQTLTNEDGRYRLFVPWLGAVNVSVNEEALTENFSSDPSGVVINFDDFGSYSENDFCISATQVFNDLNTVLFPLDNARPGFDTEYNLSFANAGTTVLNGQITLKFNSERQSFLNAIPEEEGIEGNFITFQFQDLLPFEERSILIVFNTLPPPINESDDILIFTAEVKPLDNDFTPEDNTYILEQIIINSQDPNDKLVAQGTTIEPQEVGLYLEYVIRFQNVGTASAINVRVEDELSANLQKNTLKIISSSHPFSLEIENQNKLIFSFNNIDLPPEMSDPEGSNGFVAFKIKSNNNLEIGDKIVNTASIYFDFNAPIITNTVVTEIAIPPSDEVSFSGVINLHPVPIKDFLQISSSNGITYLRCEIFGTSERKVLETSKKTIDFSSLAAGVYFVKVFTNKGNFTKKVIKQ